MLQKTSDGIIVFCFAMLGAFAQLLIFCFEAKQISDLILAAGEAEKDLCMSFEKFCDAFTNLKGCVCCVLSISFITGVTYATVYFGTND
jgi:hypothetical protein